MELEYGIKWISIRSLHVISTQRAHTHTNTEFQRYDDDHRISELIVSVNCVLREHRQKKIVRIHENYQEGGVCVYVSSEKLHVFQFHIE